jgi:predicted nucleic-acid-binding protein
VIALDTNILVRLLTGDDPPQQAAVTRLLHAEESGFFIGDVTLAELAWVLEKVYRYTREELAVSVEELASLEDVQFEDTVRVAHAIKHHRHGGDFADFLIVARARASGCSQVASFDKQLQVAFPGYAFQPR